MRKRKRVTTVLAALFCALQFYWKKRLTRVSHLVSFSPGAYYT